MRYYIYYLCKNYHVKYGYSTKGKESQFTDLL